LGQYLAKIKSLSAGILNFFSVVKCQLPAAFNFVILLELFLLLHCRLTIGKLLGEGAFGMVLMAEADGICNTPGLTTVAIKMLKGVTSRSQHIYRIGQKRVTLFSDGNAM